MTDHTSDFSQADVTERLAAIVESSNDAIVSKNLNGIITTWNKGAEQIFGYTADEIIGKSILTLIPPDRQDEEPRIMERLQAGQRIDHYETVRLRKDGTRLDVSVTISPVRDASGRIVGASKVARDITEQNRIRLELEAAKDAAEAANRAKDHFLSVLSHELRTPLTPVLAAVSFIVRNPSIGLEQFHDQIDMIRRNVETEARLVDDLLDLTRIARGKIQLHFEVVDAHATLRHAITMFQSEIDAKGLEVTLALRAREHHVWADPARLQQVFFNLMSNAVKFTPENGMVTIRSTNADHRLQVEIRDTGVGIEPDVLPRLFGAFVQGEHTVTRRFGGLGLGLSIVKALMELHGGSVQAQSEGKDKGTTLTLELNTVPAGSSAAPRVENSTDCRGARVLLVEDHVDTREVLTRLLRTFGCIVTTASTVREARALADREKFDLLVSDIGLPDGSGTEIMAYLRDRYNIKGIALSGFGQDDDLRRSREAGFETHLIKPVNFQTLQRVIQKVAG